ncbi:MAG: hypothetical protein KC519_02065 [Anaerolineae bacterium]|nr:hypothetical protein [Anaerolineae bacterium]
MRASRCSLAILALIFLSACTVLEPAPIVTVAPPSPAHASSPEPLLPTPTDLPFPWQDANAIMSGICFEAANDAAGQLFILRSADDLASFYDLADGSELCRHPVQRDPYDFGSGNVLAGFWNRGVGCIAFHEVVEVLRDETAKILSIRLRFVTQGQCNYELVRPFWIGLENMADYDIRISVE